MKPALHLTMKQTLSLSPKLQQAIKLLQMSAGELETEIQAALDSNPLLELVDDWDAEPTYSSAQSSDIEWQNLTPAKATLREYLSWQLNLTPFSDRDRIIAMTLIDSINDDGYLTVPPAELAEFFHLDLTEIMAVLHRVQQFDPAGVAAQNLSECMLLQLQVLAIDALLLKQCSILVTEHLELLGKKDYAAIKHVMSINDQELNRIVAQIKTLHPKPGAIINDVMPEYIVPDVIANKTNNRWHVALNPNIQYNLRINANYAECASLRKQLIEAQWLLDSIKNRNATLLKVAAYIVRFQVEFLEHGAERMQPLILQKIAQDLNLSESTISRITTKKYMHTPRGTFELKFFFSSFVPGNDGEHCSSIAVKAIIQQLIKNENRATPLSDQQITQLMEKRGINIARRTVAKYREALGIQASTQRGN